MFAATAATAAVELAPTRVVAQDDPARRERAGTVALLRRVAPATATGAAAFLLALGLVAPWPNTALALLVAAMAIAAVLPAVGALARGPLNLLELGVVISAASFALFPARAAIVLLDADHTTHPHVLDAPQDVERLSLAALAAGLTAGGLAYNVAIRRQLGRRVRLPRIDAFERPPFLLSIGVLLVGIVAQGFVLVANRIPGYTDIGAVGGPRAAGLVSAASALMLIALALLARRAAVDRTWRARGLLAAAAAATVALGFAGRYKEVAIFGILVPLVVWHFSARRGLRPRVVIAMAAVVLFVIFPSVQVVRLAAIRLDTGNPVELVKAFPDQATNYSIRAPGPRRPDRTFEIPRDAALVVSRRLYGFESFTLAVRKTPSELPHQYGRQTFSQLAAGAVPRVVWPEKPSIGLGLWFALNYWPATDPNVPIVPQSMTHAGELWIDFGLPGVIVGLALLGVWYAFVWGGVRPWESGTAAIVYAIVFVHVIVIDRDLPLVYVTLLQRLGVLTLLALALVAFARLRRDELTTRPVLAVGRRVRHRHVASAVAGLPPPSSVLDAGCGDGRLALRIARRLPSATVLAVDDDPAILGRGERSAAGQPNLELRRTAVGGDDLGRRFDLVLCVDVLEHIDDDRRATAWLFRHVAPGGHLVVHVPARAQRHRIRSLGDEGRARIAARRDQHVREGYDAAELSAMLEEAGFVDVRTASTFHRAATQLAEDVDTWAFTRRARWVKAICLPLLLLAAAVERTPARGRVGWGVLATASAPAGAVAATEHSEPEGE